MDEVSDAMARLVRDSGRGLVNATLIPGPPSSRGMGRSFAIDVQLALPKPGGGPDAPVAADWSEKCLRELSSLRAPDWNGSAPALRAQAGEMEGVLQRCRRGLGEAPIEAPDSGIPVSQVAEEVSHRLPYGPIDLTVGSYLDSAAIQEGLLDEKWSVSGGIKVPRDRSEYPRSAARLHADPLRLHVSTLDVTYTGRYERTLGFVKLVFDSPWSLWVPSLAIRWSPGSRRTQVAMRSNYAFE
jgi:hypothetical protein